MAQRLNKAELISRIAEFDNFDTKKQAGEFLEDIIGLIQDTVIAGGEVSIAGFGKFEKFTSSTTGRKKPKFTAFKDFKDAVNA